MLSRHAHEFTSHVLQHYAILNRKSTVSNWQGAGLKPCGKVLWLVNGMD